MKYFWFIFSILIFCLSVAPCCGEEAEATAKAVAATELYSADDHGSHAHEVCSPFCLCACCGYHAFQVNTVPFWKLDKMVPAIAQKADCYTFCFISKFEASIWQPPQLA